MLDWTPPHDWRAPDHLSGQFARLERLQADHAAALWPAMEGHPAVWQYLFEGPFETEAAFAAHIARQAAATDTIFYAIQGEEGWAGVASYLRVNRDSGSIEIGNLCFSPRLQRTRAATEVIWLLADEAFTAGFRRLEWKCNALNGPSRRAAKRLGFHYEGTFRQHTVVKGRNRDTAWYAILDGEWPALNAACRQWLAPENFDPAGRQRQSLSALMGPVVAGLDRPAVEDPSR